MRDDLPVMNTYERLRDDHTTADCWNSEDDCCLPHFHHSVELVYVTEGMLTAIVDGQTMHVRQGQLLICSSYAVHTYISEEHNRGVVMTIPLGSVPSLQKRLQKAVFKKQVWDVKEGGSAELAYLLPLLAQGWEGYGAETRKGFSYAVLGMLVDRVGLTEVQTGQQRGPMGSTLRDVLNYLQEHYQGSLGLEEVARHFGYSKNRFSRLFRDHLGCSMNAYLTTIRCRRAAEMLLDSEQTMLEIAANAGFECLRTFYRAFRACYHCTPSQYVRGQMQTGLHKKEEGI